MNCQNPRCENKTETGKSGKAKMYCSDACRVMARRLRLNPDTRPKTRQKTQSMLVQFDNSKNSPKTAKFFCDVARKLASAEIDLRLNPTLYEKAEERRLRCLAGIAEISKRADVRQFHPDKAEKMDQYINQFGGAS